MRETLGDNDSRQRPVTMEDVAERAGVSRALVSIVFRNVPGASDQNRAKVFKAAEELSYRPDQRARLLGRKRSQTIGITFHLHDEAHTGFVEDLYREADAAGYHLVLSPVTSFRSERDATNSLLEYRCEAIIIVAPNQTDSHMRVIAEHVRVVAIGRRGKSDQWSTVLNDDAHGARLAVEHLTSLGHRSIAHVHGKRAAGAQQRAAGYRTAMRAAGLADYVRLVPGGLTETSGRDAADLLVRDELPTAVYVYNDQCAAGLITRLRELDVDVPGRLSVVGNDNARVARSPSLLLTTVALAGPELARHALELCIEPTDKTAEIVVAPRLIVRSTTTKLSEAGLSPSRPNGGVGDG